MKTLKLTWQKIICMIQQFDSLHETIALASEQQAELNEREAKRLDRICNPSKYLGK